MSAHALLHLSPQPRYAQINDTLRERILDGTYSPHSQMPSEHDLCVAFGVSRITVRQALGDLQQEGLIFRLHGKGTFVSRPKALQNVTSLQGFAEAMSSMGYEIVNRMQRFRVVKADRRQASRLQLQEGAPVLRIERLTHDTTGRPLDYEFLYFRADAFQYRLRIDRDKPHPDTRTQA